MNNLEVRFHGICTHYNVHPMLHRVILLQCEPGKEGPHRAILSVPPSTKVKSGSGCQCIKRVDIHPADGDHHYTLDGVHLTMVTPVKVVLLDPVLWWCGIPKLTRLYPALGPVSKEKVLDVPPVEVSAWFDVTAGSLTPYESLKGAVAVRLMVSFEEAIQIQAKCWQCEETWTFTFEDGSVIRVSNDCGDAGDVHDFAVHFRIAEHPPTNPPLLTELPECLPERPAWADWPPGPQNASLGCSNSDYP